MLRQVDTATLRNNLADVLNEIAGKKDYMLVTRKAKPVSAIINLDFLEDLLAATSSKYLKSVREAREDAKKGRLSSHAEVFGKL